MIPVFQTRYGRDGNCLQAALASILECPILDVPQDLSEFGWEVPLAEWLGERYDLTYFEFSVPDGYERERDFMAKLLGFHLIGGESSPGLHHACVAYQGRIIHDPSGRVGGEPLMMDRPRYFGVLARRFGSLPSEMAIDQQRRIV